MYMCGRYNTNKNFPRPYTWNEQGESLTVKTLGELLRFVSAVRIQRGGDLQPGWQDRICNQICEDPIMKFNCSQTGGHDVREIQASDVKRFFTTVAKWASDGGTMVDSGEAERRASICAACPQNVPIRGCMGCSTILPKLLKVIGGATTSKDALLKGCKICGCELKAKVHLPSDVMVDGESNFPEHCWIRTEQE